MHEGETASFYRDEWAKTLSMLTAYTCPVARSIEEACVLIMLVGDTVGMVEMGSKARLMYFKRWPAKPEIR
ncbi:3-methyl-2-oxobutanoate hydroxymethyltransferase [Vreelandella venusta]|uniref:3-methyl-2-oxobutanoate hydroxymethyltransferase n=1 Tax=Vreelandella venusta TaxID=44935 RepID=UPI002286A9A7|nr:3-methyl-2-oxobutanoate hydroxymethyltransferase [Halomonas venusta]WAM57085.1 3-methyl-2-oxobutanoate hydroxymethyltransferase [Halomonas venusta]